ncbi:unnamed protein product [Linum trigynum]|uniref:Uncharacterized protein n=1 Tax=Linum trigynum TaxID=586398 RepID=A0AAV2GKI5_9ROSI
MPIIRDDPLTPSFTLSRRSGAGGVVDGTSAAAASTRGRAACAVNKGRRRISITKRKLHVVDLRLLAMGLS